MELAIESHNFRMDIEYAVACIPLPITVAARSEAWALLARMNTEIVGSNPTQGVDVCLRLFCVCVVLCR
jgi:hypothetical protein